MTLIVLLLIVAAVVVFALGVPPLPARISLTNLGLCLLALALLLSGHVVSLPGL